MSSDNILNYRPAYHNFIYDMLIKRIPLEVIAKVDIRAFLDNGENAPVIKKGTIFRIIKNRISPNSNTVFFVTDITYNYAGKTYNMFIEYNKTDNTIRASKNGTTVRTPLLGAIRIVPNGIKNNVINKCDIPVSSSIIPYPSNFNIIPSGEGVDKHPFTNASSEVLFNSVDNRIYMSFYKGELGVIKIINPVTLNVEDVINMPFNIFHWDYSPVDNKILGTSASTDDYCIIDCKTKKVTIIGGILSYQGNDVVYNSVKNSFYITDISHNLHEISSKTGLRIFSINTGFYVSSMTFVPKINSLYIIIPVTKSVIIWDCNTNSKSGFPILVNINNVFCIKYCSAKNTVYVGGYGGVKEIDVAKNILLLAFFPNVALNFAYHVPSNVMYYSSTLDFSIIDCKTNTILNTFNSGLSSPMDAPFFTVDTKNNRIFSTCDGQNADGSHVYYVWKIDECYYNKNNDSQNNTLSNADGITDVSEINKNNNDFLKYGIIMIAISVAIFVGLDIYKKVKK